MTKSHQVSVASVDYFRNSGRKTGGRGGWAKSHPPPTRDRVNNATALWWFSVLSIVFSTTCDMAVSRIQQKCKALDAVESSRVALLGSYWKTKKWSEMSTRSCFHGNRPVSHTRIQTKLCAFRVLCVESLEMPNLVPEALNSIIRVRSQAVRDVN